MGDRVEYLLFLLLRLIVTILPLRTARRLGSFLGWFTYRIIGYRKRVTTENLRAAFPEKTGRERNRIAEGAFRNYAISIVDMLWTAVASDDELIRDVTIRDRSLLDRCVASGEGFTVLSGHFGSFQQIPHGLRLQIGKPMSILVQRQRNRWVDKIVDEARCRHGNRTIPMGPSAREALRTLQSGGVLAALGDQSGPKEAVFVEFFGRPAATHRGIAAFSLKTQTTILQVTMIRKDDGNCEAVVEEIDRSGIGEYSDENINELTRRHVQNLERRIREYPDQWLWMHKRWKHTPEP